MRAYASRWYRSGLWLPASAALLALLAALTSQYAFGLHPCELCLVQRWPYAFAVVGAVTASFRENRRIWNFMLLSLASLFMMEGGIALFHVGVENHWWTYGGGCSGSTPTGSLEDIRASIYGSPLVRCDTPQFTFLGLSMAAWNSLYAFACSALTVRQWRKNR